jgi:hypothetical protein
MGRPASHGVSLGVEWHTESLIDTLGESTEETRVCVVFYGFGQLSALWVPVPL